MMHERWSLVRMVLLFIVAAQAVDGNTARGEDAVITVENRWVRYAIGADGRNAAFVDKDSGADVSQPGAPCARVRIGKAHHDATAAAREGEGVRLDFGETGVRAVLRYEAHDTCLTVEVVALEGPPVDEFVFCHIPLTLAGTAAEPFAACALAANLQTDVHGIPQASGQLAAMCYPRFGFAGARAAVIGCPRERLREAMQAVVRAEEGIPYSPLGGPFALDSEATRGSYLMDTRASVTEESVDDWIRLARDLGITQLDFHIGVSMRFGDCEPSPELYPDGLASVRRVTDRLYEAGILSGLHTYAFFLAKDTPWVAPIPHKDLAKAATYTLAAALPREATAIRVKESTEKVSTETGFFSTNSKTLQIGDELIVFDEVADQGFASCQRGALGTTAAEHPAGAPVYELKQLFNLFLPEPDSTLFEAVIERTAHAYNAGGFRMMYLDALDGSYMLAGPENAWHYGSKFTFELVKRLERPPLLEMSTFHHHLWYVRSRLGAWDYPKRGYKPFIDMHTTANAYSESVFMPAHLGWWGRWEWGGLAHERTFPDDIEYACCKALAHDSGLSWIVGFDKDSYFQSHDARRLGRMIRRYETLRLARAVPEPILARLRERGQEFTLEEGRDEKPVFIPIRRHRHTVQREPESHRWTIDNPYAEQTARLRIEALFSAADYDDPASTALFNLDDAAAFSQRRIQDGIAADAAVADGRLVLSATNGTDSRIASWADFGRPLEPPADLRERGLGVWVDGDGSGALLNVQPRSPMSWEGAIADHYVTLDFAGRRYIERIEQEAERLVDYGWPYCTHRDQWDTVGLLGSAYTSFFFPLERDKVKVFHLWLNDLPPGKPVSCAVGPVKSLPLKRAAWRNPTVAVNGRRVVFPVTLETGQYLDFDPDRPCTVYDTAGTPIAEVTPEGEIPQLRPGANDIAFACEHDAETVPRARVSVIARGEPLGAP